MIFNSLTFVVFFALVLALHNAPFSWRQKKINLLVASYIFYAAWNPPFVILLWVSTVVDWWAAQWMVRSSRQATRKAWMIISVVVNLGMLGYFKYGEFLLANFVTLMGSIGVEYRPPEWNIILPVGISFYTFATLSYTLDVYLKRAKPAKSFLDYALFVTFFPHLVAGPIMRPTELVPQFAEARRATAHQLQFGLALIILGSILLARFVAWVGLRITDRMKDIIITAGGKNISPSELENALKTSPYIREAMVLGDGRKHLSALIGPLAGDVLTDEVFDERLARVIGDARFGVHQAQRGG